MGNITANGGTSPLAMMAVARQLRLQRFQILMMRETLRALADKDGFVNRESYDLSLVRSKITQPDAVQIFDLLFTMWDHHAIGEIPAKKFSVGIAPLACSCEDIPSVLRFSLHVNGEAGQGITRKALHDTLISIDTTASYFGDVHLEPGDIDNIVEAAFDLRNGRRVPSLPCDLLVRRMHNNPYIKRFVSGKARSRVQFKEFVEVATDYVPRVPLGLRVQTDNATLKTPTVNKENNQTALAQVPQDQDTKNALQVPTTPKRSNSGLDEAPSWSSFFTEDTLKSSRDPPSTIIINPYHQMVSSPISFVRGADPPSF